MGINSYKIKLFSQSKAATSGLGESKDLLSPMTLFQFTAVSRVKSPPTRESKFGEDYLPQKSSGYSGHSFAATLSSCMTECCHIFTEMQKLQALGLVYFCYLFLFSGLEFTLSFLTHQRFHFTRYEVIDKV